MTESWGHAALSLQGTLESAQVGSWGKWEGRGSTAACGMRGWGAPAQLPPRSIPQESPDARWALQSPWPLWGS